MKNKITTLAHAAATKVAAAATSAWDWVKMAAGVVKSTVALIANKIATVAVTVAQKIAAVASKAWAAVLNAIMAANPIGLIIIAVVALIAIVIVLIKNWDTVKEFFIAFGKKVSKIFWICVDAIVTAFTWVAEKVKAIFSVMGDFFSFIGSKIAEGFLFAINGIINAFLWLFEKIKSIAMAIPEFIKNHLAVILQVVAVILFGVVDLIAVAIYQIIKNWDKVKSALKKIWTAVVKVAITAIKQFILAAVEFIKRVWSSIARFSPDSGKA